MSEYVYLGDRCTAAELKGARCTAVRRANGKCIRDRMGKLVSFGGVRHVVLGRRLRRVQA